MILHSTFWENPATLRHPLVCEKLYGRRITGLGGSAGPALGSRYTMYLLLSSTWAWGTRHSLGSTHQLILREGMFLQRVCCFATWPSGYLVKGNLEPPTACWRRQSANQAPRLNDTPIQNGSVAPNLGRKSLLYVAVKSFRNWYTLKR
jgi:hypothetical protein